MVEKKDASVEDNKEEYLTLENTSLSYFITLNSNTMVTIKRKIAAFLLLLIISITPFSTSKGNTEIFYKYSYKSCPETRHVFTMRRVVNCETNAPLYTEVISETIYYTIYSTQFCDGGFGWCIAEEEQPCGPEDTYEISYLPPRCE